MSTVTPLATDSGQRLLLISRMPPTTNKLFYNSPGKGRRKTAPYRAWLVEAGWELKAQRITPLAGPVAIDITLPDRRGRLPDADNALKASIDLLVRHRIIEEDDRSIVRRVSATWDASVGLVAIRLTSLAAIPDQDGQTVSHSGEAVPGGERACAATDADASRKGEAR